MSYLRDYRKVESYQEASWSSMSTLEEELAKLEQNIYSNFDSEELEGNIGVMHLIATHFHYWYDSLCLQLILSLFQIL